MPESIDLLAGYLTKAEFASAIHVNERTIDNYRKAPDGLPYLAIGGRVYIPVAAAREWLARREVHPNPVRKAG